MEYISGGRELAHICIFGKWVYLIASSYQQEYWVWNSNMVISPPVWSVHWYSKCAPTLLSTGLQYREKQLQWETAIDFDWKCKTAQNRNGYHTTFFLMLFCLFFSVSYPDIRHWSPLIAKVCCKRHTVHDNVIKLCHSLGTQVGVRQWDNKEKQNKQKDILHCQSLIHLSWTLNVWWKYFNRLRGFISTTF